VARREPEAVHRRREERGDEELRKRRGAAEQQGPAGLLVGRRRELVAAFPGKRPVRQPRPGQREREHRRPAQQPVVAVQDQGHQPVGAFQVAERERRVGRRLALEVSRVGSGTAVQRLVHQHVGNRAHRHQPHPGDRDRASPAGPHGADGEDADHEPGRRELRPEPGQSPEQRRASEPRGPRWRPLREPQRQQRRPGQGGARRELRIDGRAVCEQRRRHADRERREQRPPIRDKPAREQVGQRATHGRDHRQEELHRDRPPEHERRRDQGREAGAVRLVQSPVARGAVHVEVVGVEAGVLARGVVVEHVEVAVLDQRARGQQVVGLVAAVVGRTEGVEAQRRRVERQQRDEDRDGAAGGTGHGAARQAPSALAMIICCTSSVPSPIVRIFASR